MAFKEVYSVFTRRKPIDEPEESKLSRCLSTLDLTTLGIGSTLGVGVYVLAGSVSRDLAGPAVIISFAIAAVASMIAGLCYAEFGARVPRAGSAYIYSYVTVGEFIAFLIGWTIILEYVIGAASVVRALSIYVDSLLNNTMKHTFASAVPINVSLLAAYPDFFAFSVTLLFTAALAFGAKESSLVNNIFTFTNLIVVLFIVIAGSFKADFSNWKLTPNCTEDDCSRGTGGFAPFGAAGVLAGAAKCFYGFIGFDCVATTGEEAKNPQKSIPIAIIASLTVVFLAYVGVSTVLTMVLPYYDQNPDAPFPHLFEQIHWDWAKWIVSIGAICALCASLMGSMLPLPRVIYAMASDGLIFKWMGKISPRFHTPILGTIAAGLLTGVLAAIFELIHLVDIMSIGTLLSYSIVAACVLILRYEESEPREKKENRPRTTFCMILKQLVNWNKLTRSTDITAKIVTILVVCYFILSTAISVIVSVYSKEVSNGNIGFITTLAVLITVLLLILLFVYLQPTSENKLSFSVPGVPFLPCLSILINIYLMMLLDSMTWIRFAVWMVIGLAIYFCYGIWNSAIRVRKQPTKVTDEESK